MLRNKIFIRILAVIALVAFLAMSVFIAVSPLTAGANSIQDAQRRQQEATQKKEAAITSQNDEIKKREELDRQINAVTAEIEEYQTKIDQKAQAISASEAKINELSADMQKQNSDYNERAKRLIKKGNVSYTEIIMRASSLEDMLSRASIVKRVAEYDSDKLDEIENSMQEVKAMKEDLLKQKQEVINLKAEQDSKKQTLDGYRQESQAIIDNLQKDIEAYEKEFELAKQAEVQARAAAEQARLQSDAGNGTSSSGSAVAPPVFSGGQFQWPSNTTRLVTSPYGYRIHPVTGRSRFHSGIDIGASYGTDILAASDGVVIVSGYNSGGYGNYVVINHGGGYTTLYAHCSSLLVSKGQSVSRGQIIAKCGSTGMSTGPHIHFEVQYNGKTTNPMQYFN